MHKDFSWRKALTAAECTRNWLKRHLWSIRIVTQNILLSFSVLSWHKKLWRQFSGETKIISSFPMHWSRGLAIPTRNRLSALKPLYQAAASPLQWFWPCRCPCTRLQGRQDWGCKGLSAARNSHLNKSSFGGKGMAGSYHWFFWGCPLPSCFINEVALFIVLIHWRLDQRIIRKSSTCIARLSWIYYSVWIPGSCCNSWTGTMTVTVSILRDFQRVWQSHPDLVKQPVLP